MTKPSYEYIKQFNNWKTDFQEYKYFKYSKYIQHTL